MDNVESRARRGKRVRKVPVALWLAERKCLVKRSLGSSTRPRYLICGLQGMTDCWNWSGGGGAGWRLDIVHIGIEAQHGVCAAVCACDMTMFSVTYVSGFIAKHLLNNSNYDICKKTSDIWSAIITLCLHRIQEAQQYSIVSYISIWEVIVLENVVSKVAHLESVEFK